LQFITAGDALDSIDEISLAASLSSTPCSLLLRKGRLAWREIDDYGWRSLSQTICLFPSKSIVDHINVM
jgi:hypothetical protein